MEDLWCSETLTDKHKLEDTLIYEFRLMQPWLFYPRAIFSFTCIILPCAHKNINKTKVWKRENHNPNRYMCAWACDTILLHEKPRVVKQFDVKENFICTCTCSGCSNWQWCMWRLIILFKYKKNASWYHAFTHRLYQTASKFVQNRHLFFGVVE